MLILSHSPFKGFSCSPHLGSFCFSGDRKQAWLAWLAMNLKCHFWRNRLRRQTWHFVPNRHQLFHPGRVHAFSKANCLLLPSQTFIVWLFHWQKNLKVPQVPIGLSFLTFLVYCVCRQWCLQRPPLQKLPGADKMRLTSGKNGTVCSCSLGFF